MNEHEPIHVEKGKCNVKIVLVPKIEISYNRGFKKSEMRNILDIIVCNHEKIVEAWHHAFNK